VSFKSHTHSPGGRAGTKVTVHAVDVVVRLAHRRLRQRDTIALIYPLVLTFKYARVADLNQTVERDDIVTFYLAAPLNDTESNSS
jgi:hypothetical protein